MAFGSEFWAAIAGATVGGIIALFVQLVAIRAAAKQRASEKNELKLALAHSVMFKTMRINSNLFNLHSHLEESFAAIDSNSEEEPFSGVLPLANSPYHVHYSTEELSLVLSLKNPILTNLLMQLDLIHNSLIDGIVAYRDLRLDLQNQMPAEMVGTKGESRFTEEEWLVVRPRMVALNKLVEDLRVRAKVDFEDSKKALEMAYDTMNEALNFEFKLEFDSGKQAALDKFTGGSASG